MASSKNPLKALSSDHHLPQLIAVAEKILPAKCKPQTIAYCPTMDLVALAADDKQLHVFRLNGQRVFGGSFAGEEYLDEGAGGKEGEEKEEKDVMRAVKWKNDGLLLAVAYADDKIRIISSYSGRTVHQYLARQQRLGEDMISDPQCHSRITCLGWGINFTDSKAAERQLHNVDGPVRVEDLFAPDTHPSKAKSLLRADLPRELALLDVEGSLPKLSTLPATGSDEDVFSSRSSLDTMFHAMNRNSGDSVDVLVVGFNDGTVHLRIFDSFEIGSFQILSAAGRANECDILLHASHPMSSTHALLVVDHNEQSQNSTRLLTLDLRFITKSGRYLSLLASKTTQLQNLLRYISQVQWQIQLEWKNAQDLPARFMRSANEDLHRKCHCDFVTAAYHLVATGDCFEPLKEFLVEVIGERGHKRWEKSVSTGYENVRRLAHECLLPALERCGVILSRLMGISKFHKLSHVLGLETRDLRMVVDTVDCLHLLAHKVLIYSSQELREFLAFAKWLRHEIDVQTAEPMSQTLEELMEKSDMIDHGPTLCYIQGALTNSILQHFIQPPPGMGAFRPPPTAPSPWVAAGRDHTFYETYKIMLTQLEKQVSGWYDGPQVDLPKLHDLTGRLGLQCDQVFGQIALAQRRGILHRCPLVLHPDTDQKIMDIVMQFTNSDGKVPCSVYVAAKSRTTQYMFSIYRVTLACINGVSSMKEALIAPLSIQKGEIKQIQFVEDHTVMVLWSNEAGRCYLLNISVDPLISPDANTELVDTFSPTYVPFDSFRASSLEPPQSNILELSPDSVHADLVLHAFPFPGPKARPIRFAVNGRKERRAVCVLYEDGEQYDVLDLDGRTPDEEEEDDLSIEGTNRNDDERTVDPTSV